MVAMNDYFEVDLPGEVCGCDHHPMDGVVECDCPCHEPDFDPTPRPYDFEGPARVIPFPGAWELDPEPPAACALCGEAGADPASGVCRICADRLPKVGGCGLAVWLVAGLTGGESGPALDHLTACTDCRTFFDRLGDLARVADMETSHADAGKLAA